MANANASADTQQIKKLLAALGRKLAKLSAEEIGRLHGKKDVFAEQCGAVATNLAQPEPAHETIRIPCLIGGREYLACGFLKADESSAKGQVMLDRTQVEGTTAIDDAEMDHLLEHRKDFQQFPELDPYYLATERHNPNLPGYLSGLYRVGAERYGDSHSVENHWGGGGLILRRCT